MPAITHPDRAKLDEFAAGHIAIAAGKSPAAEQSLAEGDMRPGERLLHGRRYVFNADMLADHLAREAVENAPADYRTLTLSELALLGNRAVRVWALERGAPGLHSEVCCAVTAERARRGLHSAGCPLPTANARVA